jgi:hypothetical protein
MMNYGVWKQNSVLDDCNGAIDCGGTTNDPLMVYRGLPPSTVEVKG